LQQPYKSVKAKGYSGPKQGYKLVLPNGCVAPLGEVAEYYDENSDNYPDLDCDENEYIVYDPAQVRMRYLIEVD